MSKLDSLIVDLQLNSAELRKGLDDANQKLDGFGKKIDSLAGVIKFEKIAGAVKHVVEVLGSFVLKGAEAADHIGKAAQAAGVATESFSRLNYAARLSDIGTEQLSSSMSKLNKNIADAATGQKEQVAVFSALGVKVTDTSGKVRAADAVFSDLAEVFSHMRDGASKSKLAMELFGKSGAELIPLLNAGKTGLAEMGAEADRLGFTISQSAASSAEKFNDNLTRLKVAFESVAQRAAAELAPSLANLTDQLINSRDGASQLAGLSEVLATGLRLVASVGVIVAAVFEAVGKSIAAAASTAVSFVSGDFRGAAEMFIANHLNMIDVGKSALDKLKAVWDSTAQETAKQSAVVNANADKIAAKLEAMKKAASEYESAMKALTKVALDYESKVSSFGQGPLALLEARLEKGDLAAELGKIGDKATEMKDRILAAAAALQELELGKLNTQLEMDRERKSASTGAAISDRRNEYVNNTSGFTERRKVESKTAGFTDFEDALQKLAENTNKNAKALGDAEMFKLQNDLEGAQRSLLAADDAQRAADAAAKAADGFEELAKIDFEKHKAQLERIGSAITALAGQLVSKLGDLGEVIQAGIQGFQQGGWWGAIIAVVIELFSRFERFGEIIELGNQQLFDVLEQIRPALNILTDAFKEFMEFSGHLTRIIFKVIGPIIKIIGGILGYISQLLTPILGVINQVISPIMEIIDALSSAVGGLDIFAGTIKVVAVIFNAISLVILGIVFGIQWLWSGVLEIVRGVIAIFTVGQGTAEIDATIAQHQMNMAKTKEKMDRIVQNMTDPEAALDEPALDFQDALDNDLAPGFDDVANASNNAAGALNKFTESLTNVPQGFKYQLRAFESMNADGESPMSLGGRPDLNIHISGSVITERELTDVIQRLISQRNFRNTGVATTIGGRIR